MLHAFIRSGPEGVDEIDAALQERMNVSGGKVDGQTDADRQMPHTLASRAEITVVRDA